MGMLWTVMKFTPIIGKNGPKVGVVQQPVHVVIGETRQSPFSSILVFFFIYNSSLQNS
jgi:hypothetical protein